MTVQSILEKLYAAGLYAKLDEDGEPIYDDKVIEEALQGIHKMRKTPTPNKEKL